MDYSKVSVEELKSLLQQEQKELKKITKRGLVVDMTRGRPAKDQLEIAMPMLQRAGELDYALKAGDARNYGQPQGVRPAMELFAEIFDVKPEEVIVADGSSLNIMYNVIQFAMQFGVLDNEPWNKQGKIKFICPAPGYDRHFSICEKFGIEMITVPMTKTGPDMDLIEPLVASDKSIKGIWCVPKYSNPTGITFSDKTVERIATMKVAAKDFRVFWDNAYAVHALYDTDDKLKNIFDVARKAGTIDRIYSFASTSKITFGGSGVSAIAASENNIKSLLKHMFFMTIGPNKVSQVMHVDFLKDLDNIKKIMKQHADILRPKFELVEKKLSEAFEGEEYVQWSNPRGGYFISLDVKGCAKRIVEIAASVNVKFTAAGSTFPYKLDDADSNIRIAPSCPNLEEMDYAIDVLISAIKIAEIELQLKKKS